MTAEQFTIPTLPDLMRGIERWMADRAGGENIPAELQTEVDRLLDTPPTTADDLFKLMAFAKGCHTVAEERRMRGDDGNALCYHYYGQIMIENAVNLLASITAQGVDIIGETRH
jgi:hypothetical protein